MAIENMNAEQAVLGAAILGGSSRALLMLEGSDFVDTRHRVIASTLRDMMRRGVAIDRLTVCAELESVGKLATPGGAGGTLYVFDLADLGVIPQNAEYYAEQVRTSTRTRQFRDAARLVAEKCELEDASSHLDELLRIHRTALDAIPAPLGTGDTDDTHDQLGTMLSEQDEATDWLIPGLLAREERVVIVAGEGVAKTTLLRQIAVCLGGGLNPWSGQRVSRGLRVLFIDTENSRAQSRRAYRWIAGRCHRPTMDPGWKSNIVHKTRNDGVNLLGKDEPWFRDLADRVSPDVIILSPAYKLMRGDPKEDRDVLGLLDVIDRVRVQHKAAVLIETHAPHGSFMSRDMRPFGSSVWLRWPEIGFGLQRDSAIPTEHQKRRPEELETVDWRGAREPRDWPDQIRYGGPRELPWVPNCEWAPSIDVSYRIPEGEAA